jgi:hypothetical protein
MLGAAKGFQVQGQGRNVNIEAFIATSCFLSPHISHSLVIALHQHVSTILVSGARANLHQDASVGASSTVIPNLQKTKQS